MIIGYSTSRLRVLNLSIMPSRHLFISESSEGADAKDAKALNQMPHHPGENIILVFLDHHGDKNQFAALPSLPEKVLCSKAGSLRCNAGQYPQEKCQPVDNLWINSRKTPSETPGRGCLKFVSSLFFSCGLCSICFF